jgi:hypothetical protein
MTPPDKPVSSPDPSDWVTQTQLAQLLGVSRQTASQWARAGKLASYEHGCPNCGRRKYSRTLVDRERELCWREALDRQDSFLGETKS